MLTTARPRGLNIFRGTRTFAESQLEIRNEALSLLLQSYQGWGVDVSEGDVDLEEVNIKLVISEEEDSRGNSLCLSPDGVDSVQHQV